MTPPPIKRPTYRVLTASAEKCLANGARLLDETCDLEFRDVSATRFYMAMIAQEEFAKAFMLLLVRDDVVPFSRPVLRAMNDHSCKQLVGIIMDYVIMHWDDLDEIKTMIAAEVEFGDRFPDDVGSALEMLRYEKIGRWEGGVWCWAEDPNYDRGTQDVSDGKRDRLKQDALYVRIGKDGHAVSVPDRISITETKIEEDRAVRYKGLIGSALQGGTPPFRYEKTIKALRALFGSRT
jgi:hypothetical protein